MVSKTPFIGVVMAVCIGYGGAWSADIEITVKDLTPKFLTFYRAAMAEQASPDRRFELWKQDYDFAAVPPTPEGDLIARKLLDAAWPKYPSVMAQIEKGEAGMEPSPEQMLRRVVAQLKPDHPVHIAVLAYVGALETNAFTTTGKDGVPTVALPVEISPQRRGPLMAHEFTHAIQITLGTNSGGWIRTIGETVLSEGLAMKVAQSLYPDRPAASFVELVEEPGWLAKADAKHSVILHDISGVLDSSSSDDVMRFTMGAGPSGLDREAYYAGWVVVGYWLKHGKSFAEIARISEVDAPAQVRAAIAQILADR